MEDERTREQLSIDLSEAQRRIVELEGRIDILEREEEARLKLGAIVESSDDAIVSKTLDGIITSWNNAAERIFGYSSEEAIGRSITMLIPVERLDEEPQIIERLKRGEHIDHYETVRVTKDGRALDISLTISPIKNASGKIVGASKIARDITERKQAEQAIRENREWLQVTLSSIGDAVIATNREGLVSFINPVAESLTGWSQQEADGVDLARVFSIFNEETRQRVESPIAEVLREGTIARLASPTVLIRRDGTEIPIDDSGAPIKDASGKILGAILVFRSVTERRQIEKWSVELLAREREARKHAEEASRLKDEFLATISHELRTPLTSILGWSSMLRANDLGDADVARALETIERNAKSLAQLVQDLLDISRVATGQIRLEMRPLYPGSVINVAVEALRPAAQAKGIRLQTVLDTGAGPVLGDQGRLQQVLWNLLSNAVKFTPSGGKVTIVLEAHERSAVISVTDTGKGIAGEFLPFVFEKFTQADSSIRRSYGGLGMGLAIVKSLVELHGGTVEASSPGQGRGATFSIKLPIAERDVPVAEQERAPAPGAPSLSKIDAAPLRGLRVLVVDDEADTLEMLQTLLKRCGMEVRVAGSAVAALQTMDEWQPQLLLADVGMPEQSGYDLIGEVRARPSSRGGKVPAIALTAFARVEDRMRALTAGYQMHVPKPIEPDELISILVNLAGLIGDNR
jgi:PAS domain S-box-containing protein